MENYMEYLVDEVFREMESNFRRLATCVFEPLAHDIKAFALNNLAPMYFSSTASDAEKKAFLLNKQTRIAVAAKLAEAFNILCKAE